MIFGVDLSRYDSASPGDVSAVDDPWAEFVILNIEDPGCANKAAEAKAIGKPWALYSWLYAGQGASSVTRLQAMVDLLVLNGVGHPPKGGFVDFEDNGVSTADATAARLASAGIATPTGLYTYLALLNGMPGLADEWWRWAGRWIAYYPSDSPAFPSGQIGTAQAWGSMLWQFTSSGGTRDRNVVVDEAAWAAWGDATEPEDDDMKPLYISKKSAPGLGIWVTDGQWKRHVLPDEWAFVTFTGGGPPPLVALSDAWWDSIPTAGVGMVNGGDIYNIAHATAALIPASGGGSSGPLKVSLTGSAVPV